MITATKIGVSAILRVALPKLAYLKSIRISLGIVAFLIYTCTTLLANQTTQIGIWLSYDIERTAMASAISNIVYGAPIATVYRNLWGTFVARPAVPLDELLQQAKKKQIPPGELMPYVADGIGIGQAVFTTIAMRIFGIHHQAIVILFLILMGISTFTFLLRYGDERSFGILCVFLALTLMLASPLGTQYQMISQVPVGGHRYFSLLAVLPFLHIFLELIQSRREMVISKRNLGLLAVQSLLLMIAYFMNIGSTYVLFPLTAAAIFILIGSRHVRTSIKILLGKILVVAGVVASLSFAFNLVTPDAYKVSGRAQPATLWHHVIIGFGANPNWPFGDLADQYRGCYPERPQQSLVPGMSDDNGGCPWAAYASQHGINWGEGLYSKEFDAAIREAVFKIIWEYPIQSLITVIYYKPRMILHTLAEYFELVPGSWSGPGQLAETVPGLSVVVALFIVAQIVIFASFAVRHRAYFSIRATAPVYFAFFLGAISTCGLYLAAYSIAITSFDLFFYLCALIGALSATLIATLARLLWPPRELRPVDFISDYER
jgi:hypothetical protein